MEIIVIIALLFGGVELYKAEEKRDMARQEQAVEAAVAEVEAEYQEKLEKRVYARGEYYEQDGYYISNLSPVPVKADGCDMPVLTSDLSQPRKEGDMAVSSVKVGCQ